MKTKFIIRHLFLLILILIASSSFAATGNLLKTFNLGVSDFVLDSDNGRLYATVISQNSVAVIDTGSLELIATVQIGSKPTGLALSNDGSRLFVANSGAYEIAVMDTNSFTKIKSIQTPYYPYDIEVGLNDYLYVTPGNTGSYEEIMQIDGKTGQFLGHFSLGVFVYYCGFLQISPDKKTLYFGNTGLSPATLAKYDVSTNDPLLLYVSPHGSLGSNGTDLALSHDGKSIYFTVGSGNSSGYSIAKFRTSDMSVEGTFDCGPYPRQITLNADDSIAYVVHTSGHIDMFDTNTYLWKGQIIVSDEASELIVDDYGRLYAGISDQLRVYEGYSYTPPVVSTPTFSPDGGTYNTTKSVVITCSTPGAVIHYTKDGDNPTVNDPVIASGSAVTVNKSMTLKARAWKDNWEPSVVKSGVYKIAASITLPLHAKWNMVSIPLFPSEGEWVDWTSALGGVTPTRVYAWDASANSYVISTKPVRGCGYWVRMAESAIAVIRGFPSTQAPVVDIKGSSAGRWNLIGNPLASTLEWDMSKIQVSIPGRQIMSLRQAATSNLIVDHGWYWDGISHKSVYDPYFYDVPGSKSSLLSTDGCWIRSFSDCQLIMPNE
ncbi:MAG: chitobiase/beta-hexosaminidase C-terminal domain-containing protein [Armatimonadota bacterium]